MEIFLVFLRYKKINKIKSIEIIFKRTHISKAIIINLSKMKKSNQNHGQPISNGLLNFAHSFWHTCKLKLMDMDFYFTMY
jgi:hypothetical protein